MNTVNQYSDNPERCAAPGEAPSDIKRKQRGHAPDFVFPELELSCEAIIELERARSAKLAANFAEMQAMMPYTRAQMAKPTIADCMHSMMDASERLFAATDAMFAPLHNKGDTK